MLRCDDNGKRAVICPRCLPAADGKALSEAIAEYVSLIPEDNKADDKLRSHRLEICAECVGLSDGLCAECGCYVEVRSAKRNMRCPLKKW